MKHAVILLLTGWTTVSSASAFLHTSAPRPFAPSCKHPNPRSLPILASSKILPAVYASASAALLRRARQATTKADASVLAASAALALVNLGPSNNALLSSAKRADKMFPPASSGKAKERRQAAKTWRSVVRIKILGEIAGLGWMAGAPIGVGGASPGVMRGAATVMAASAAFFMCGAGRARHDDDGTPAPLPSNVSRAVLLVDLVLASAALLAASSLVGSTRRSVCAGIFVCGASVGALEGLPKFTALLFKKKPDK